MCAGNEAFYAALYLLYFTEGPISKDILSIGWFKINLTINFAVAGLSLFRIILYFSTPIALVKSAISLLHCAVAAQNLSIIDVNERKDSKKKAS